MSKFWDHPIHSWGNCFQGKLGLGRVEMGSRCSNDSYVCEWKLSDESKGGLTSPENSFHTQEGPVRCSSHMFCSKSSGLCLFIWYNSRSHSPNRKYFRWKFQPSVLLEASIGRVASLGDHFTFFLPAVLLTPWWSVLKLLFANWPQFQILSQGLWRWKCIQFLLGVAEISQEVGMGYGQKE